MSLAAENAQQAYKTVMDKGGVAIEPRGDDDGLYVRFEKRAVYLAYKSEQENRPIYEDRVYIVIPMEDGEGHHEVTKGMKQTENGQEYEFTDRGRTYVQRFPRQWQAFLQGDKEQIIGTPLKLWPGMNPSKVKHYEYNNIYTVEQLAATSDSKLQNCGMGAKDDQRKAQAYLENAKDSAHAMAAAAENEKLRSELEMMKTQMQEMNDSFMKEMETRKTTQTKKKETKQNGDSK